MRRFLVAAACLVLSACAGGPAPDAPPPRDFASGGTWAFAFDAGPGIASAILSGPDGRPAIRVTCEAPRGDLAVTDWMFSRARQGETQATVSVAAGSRTVAARVAGDGAGRQALMFQISPLDPVFAALAPAAPVKVEAAGYTHAWAPGAASRLNDVINACRTIGS
jgi:hypothetical protein